MYVCMCVCVCDCVYRWFKIITNFNIYLDFEPEISEVVNKIADVKDWEQLAISLGLTINNIDVIKHYDHREHHQRVAEMWYDRALDYSWSKLRRELPQTYFRCICDQSIS